MTTLKVKKTKIERAVDERIDALVGRLVGECLDSSPRFEELRHKIVGIATRQLEEIIERKLKEVK